MVWRSVLRAGVVVEPLIFHFPALSQSGSIVFLSKLDLDEGRMFR